MKKLVSICLFMVAIVLLVVPMLVYAGGSSAAIGAAAVTESVNVAKEQSIPIDPQPTPGEPLTWAYLATIGGATAATLLIVQFLKVPLDKVWKIPTRSFVYFIALAILLVATAFTAGLTLNTVLLTAVNAFIVALSAYGSYEITFRKTDH